MAASIKAKKKSRLLRKKVRIRCRQGLHARPAALFVQLAKKFKSEVRVRKGRETVDGRSIMGLLSLAVSRGNTVELILEGTDAPQALRVLEQIICHDDAPVVVQVVRGHGDHGPSSGSH